MKRIVYSFMFIFLSIKAYTQKKELYVFIDYKYQSLFKFNREVNKNKDYYFSSIKILKDKNKDSGFIKKNISKEKIIYEFSLPCKVNEDQVLVFNKIKFVSSSTNRVKGGGERVFHFIKNDNKWEIGETIQLEDY